MKAWQRQHLIFITLLLGVFFLSGVLAVRYERTWDLTLNRRNQLSQTSIDLVKQLKSPMHITAFTRGNPKIKTLIRRLLSRYQQYGEINVTFKNPDSELDATRRYGITRDGELLLSYQGQTILVRVLNETAISRGVYKLLQGKTRRVLFSSGRGEYGFLKDSEFSYSILRKKLDNVDIVSHVVDLSISKKVPDDTDLLILASPQYPYDNLQIKAIKDYLTKGGKVLWLASQRANSQQPGLSRLFGARFESGFLVGQAGKKYGFKDIGYVPIVPNINEKQALFSGITTLVLFPEMSPVKILPTHAASMWHAEPLLVSTDEWLLKDNRTIKKAAQPSIVGLALSSNNLEKKASVWLIGDADFASNRYIGQGQNGDFAINLIRQLATPETSHLNIQNDMATPIVLSNSTLAYLALSMILGLPITILVFGFWFCRREQK